jgi:hypothetical protein
VVESSGLLNRRTRKSLVGSNPTLSAKRRILKGSEVNMLGLIIREPWMEMILQGKKTWEIRSRNARVRGRISLIRSQSGLIVGTTRLVHAMPVTRAQLLANLDKHGMSREEVLAEFRPRAKYLLPLYAWVFEDARRLASPRRYQHPRGAVIWVDLSKSA